jgi:hypothetical protein
MLNSSQAPLRCLAFWCLRWSIRIRSNYSIIISFSVLVFANTILPGKKKLPSLSVLVVSCQFFIWF